MNKNYILMSVFALTAITLFSCKKEKTDRTLLSDNITSGVLSVFPDSVVNLTSKKAADTAFYMTWTKADYGFDSKQAYVLELDAASSNFLKGTQISIPMGDTKMASVPHAFVDSVAKKYGVADSAVATMVARIKTILSNTDIVKPIYSNVATFKARRYAPMQPKIWVAGDFQGWDPSKGPYLDLDKATETYKGTVDMAKAGGTGEFKFTNQQNWDGISYGAGATAGTLNTAANAPNLQLTPGTYELTADLKGLTWTSNLVNWGLIGDATNQADLNGNNTPDGWESDMNMKYDQDSKKYTITADLLVGAVKFRKNDDWGTNYGDTGANGSLEGGGDNIAIATAGNYTIVLDLINLTYTITKN